MGAATVLSARQKQLVTQALPLIGQIANVLARRTRLPLEELRSVGCEAAALASLRFDEEQGVPFNGFAFTRIKGAMMDAAFYDAGAMRAAWAGGVRRTVHTVSIDDAEATLGPVEEHAVDVMAVAVLPSLEALEAAGWQQHLLVNLRAAVAELEPMERALAQAFYWESLTIAEVATKLNLSVATTRRRHDHVKQKLWRAMRRRGVDTVSP